MAILISDNIDFRANNTTRDKEGHNIMMKGSIHQDIKILNIYVPNSKASKIHKVKIY